jgi:hypothetical protein
VKPLDIEAELIAHHLGRYAESLQGVLVDAFLVLCVLVPQL